jgi:hypothetical protein
MSVSLSQPLCATLIGALLGVTNLPIVENKQSTSYDYPSGGQSVVLESRGRS